MSHVTDIILSTGIGDGEVFEDTFPNVDILKKYISDTYGEKCILKRVDELATCTVAIQANLYIIAINYCDTQALIDKFRSIKWQHSESAQLFIKSEHWRSFRIFTVTGNEQFEE